MQSVWAGGERRALDEAKARFAVAEGDLITYLNVWRGWEVSGRSRKWAYANHVAHRSMLRAADIRDQLVRHLRRLGLPRRSALEGKGMTEAEEGLVAVRRVLVQRVGGRGAVRDAARGITLLPPPW